MKAKRSVLLAGLLLAVCFCILALGSALGLTTAQLFLAFGGLGLVGMAVGTVTYQSPNVVHGTTTAPTTAQVVNCVIADVTMSDGVTPTTITHNLGSVSTNGTNGSPMVSIICLTNGTLFAGVTVSYTTNGVVLANMTSAAGGGATYRVTIWRHSLITNYTT